MPKRKQRKFTPEFRVEVVALCPAGEGSIGQVSRDLFVTVTLVREWVRRAEVDVRRGRPGHRERTRVSRVIGKHRYRVGEGDVAPSHRAEVGE